MTTCSPPRPATLRAAGEIPASRARGMSYVLKTVLDRIPGARAALPRLHQLEQSLHERGLESLNDAPLPSMAEVREQLAALVPDEDPTLREFRALMLSTLDRRARARRRDLTTYVNNDTFYAGEIGLDDFMEALQEQAAR